jgi:hypothetical protein
MNIKKRSIVTYFLAAIVGACWLIPTVILADYDGQWFSQYAVMPYEFNVPISKLQAPQDQCRWLIFADDLNECGFERAATGAAIGVGLMMIWDAIRRRCWTGGKMRG